MKNVSSQVCVFSWKGIRLFQGKAVIVFLVACIRAKANLDMVFRACYKDFSSPKRTVLHCRGIPVFYCIQEQRKSYEKDIPAKQDKKGPQTWFSGAHGHSWWTRHNPQAARQGAQTSLRLMLFEPCGVACHVRKAFSLFGAVQNM